MSYRIYTSVSIKSTLTEGVTSRFINFRTALPNSTPVLLSILLPFRNVAASFKQALDSISQQSFEQFELIAVDDHSHDQSSDLLKSYNDNRFELVNNPGNGLVDALNFGASQCQSDWIVRMDGDDIMLPDRLALLWKTIEQRPTIDLVASKVEMFSDGSLKNGYMEYMRWQNSVLNAAEISNQIYIESPFAHPSVMFRKSLLKELGGYHQGDFPEDYELWLRMHAHGANMIKIAEVLLHWRDSPNRLSRNHPAYRRSAFDRLRAQYLSRDPRVTCGRPVVFWGAGRLTRKRSQLLIDLGFPPLAWIDIDPKKIGNFLR